MSPTDDKQSRRSSPPGTLLTGTPGGWDGEDGRDEGESSGHVRW